MKMKSKMYGLISGLAFCLSASASESENASAGKQLHDGQCLSCHGTEVYQRSDARVKSHAQLQQQVKMCRHNVGANWTEPELDHVVSYLAGLYGDFKAVPAQ